MKRSGLYTASGVPIASSEDGGKPVKRPPLEALAFLRSLADAVHYAERHAFDNTAGTAHQKLTAAKGVELRFQYVPTLADRQRGSVQLGPHLFARMPVQPPEGRAADCYLHAWEIRKAFETMLINGYEGIPSLGLGPGDVLKAIGHDVKLAQEAGP